MGAATPLRTGADLASLGVFVRPTVAAAERVLPLRADLASLLPGGLRRGIVAEVPHAGLLFALMSTAMQEGAWGAFIGAPTLGLAAAVDQGIPLERLAVVDRPPPEQAAAVVAALLDAVELVVIGAGVITRAADARRLSSRMRERGSVLFVCGGPGQTWPEAVDVRLAVANASWHGMDRGHGHVRQWSLEVAASGRGAASQRRTGTVALACQHTHESLNDSNDRIVQSELKETSGEEYQHLSRVG